MITTTEERTMVRRIRSNLALAAAAVVLAFALAGTAIAGPSALTSALTKPQIKKLTKRIAKREGRRQANRVFTQRAPQLMPALGRIVRVEASKTIAPGDVDIVSVACPAGHGFVSGGYRLISADGEIFFADTAGSTTEWGVGADNFDSPVEAELTAVAFCAPAGQAVTTAGAGSIRDELREAVARQRAVRGI